VTRHSVLALVGTDHHAFERLVDWLDDWAERRGDVDLVVQHGSTRAPRFATAHAFLDHTTMRGLVEAADVVVCHGGPATISELRAAGHQPVVVPRDPALDEPVDDHQLRFTAWAASKQLVERHTGREQLLATLDRRLADGRVATIGGSDVVGRSVQRFGDLVAAAADPHGASARGPVVLFVAGFGRSGSTLLERLLGESKGVCTLGEVVHLWERGLVRDELCACGVSFSECPQWQAVGESAFGGWHNVDVERVRTLHDAVDRHRRLPATMLPWPSRATRAALLEYAGLYARSYHAAAEGSGADVVVDSSKHVSLAFALSHRRDIDLRVLQVVRDPRAVAYSWSKDVARPEARPDQGEELMARYSAVRSALWWLTSNLLVEALRVRRLPRARIRYEDLVADPQGAVSGALERLEVPVEVSMDVTADRVVDLSPSHSVAGNPKRFATGPIRLRLDDEWRRSMRPLPRTVVHALTWPVHRWYRRSETHR
jgi:UDP-N-acetylglucosamine transferase subunit ALG13